MTPKKWDWFRKHCLDFIASEGAIPPGLLQEKRKIKPLYLLMLRYETCINTFSAFAENGIYNYTYNILKNLGVTYLGTKMKVPVKLY